jgi:N-acetyl-anhydromuramyl-L-alanine amidase AmpD
MIDETYPQITSEGTEIPDELTQLTSEQDGPRMNGTDSVRYLILHCTATRVTQDYPVISLLCDHLARKFRTIGYHYYIRKDGTVTQHRKLTEVGAHCKPWNRCSLGICYEGGLNAKGHYADTRTPAQETAMHDLLISLLRLYPDACICGHRDMLYTTPKACPCFDVHREYRDLIDEIEFPEDYQ